MRRRFIVPLVGLAVLVPSLAEAAAARRGQGARPVSLTQQLYQYASTGAPPLSGSNAYVGTSDGGIGRASVRGAVRGVNTYTGGGHFTGKNTIFDRAGSINIAFKATVVSPGQITASGNFTGGTGKYKGAQGKFTFTATQQSPSTFLRVLKGAISY
jgi:hypothetical protein